MRQPDVTAYRGILLSMSDAVFLIDGEGNFKFICPNVSFIFGFSETEVEELGNLDSLIGHAYRQHLGSKPIDGKVVKNLSQTIVDKSGEIHHLIVDIKVTDLLDASYLVTCRDVTELKKQEENSLNEHRTLKALIDTIPDLIWLKDPQGKYLMCNQEFEKLYGAREEDIVGKTDRDFVGEKLASVYRKSDLQALKDSKPFKKEELLVYKGINKKIIAETTKAPIFLEEGKATGVIGIARDITDRKNSEKKLEQIFNGIREAIYIVSEQGIIIETNEGGLRLSQLPREELIGKGIWQLDGTVNSSEKFQEKFSTIKPGENLLIETTTTRLDGSTITIEVDLSVFDYGNERHYLAIAYDTSESEEQKKKLLRMTQILEKSQQRAKLGSWYLDIATNEVTWTKQIYEMYGFDPNQPPPPYTEHVKLFTDESWKKLSSHLEQTATKGIPYDLVLEMSNQHASFGWMRAQGEAVRNAQGNIVALEGSAQDITEIIVAELQMKEFINGIPDAIFSIDETGRILEVNDGACRMLGYSPEELRTKYVWDISKPILDFKGFMERYKSLNKQEPNIYDNQYRRKDGSIIDVEVSVSLFDVGDGVRFFATARDVTQRRIEERRYKSILERSPQGIAVVNEQGELRLVNPAFCKILGYHEQELIGTRIQEISDPHGLNDELTQWQQLMTDEVERISFEKRYVSKNGQLVQARVVGTKIEDSSESSGYSYLGLVEDLTEMYEAQLARKKAETYYENLLKNAPNAIHLVSRDGILIDVNDLAFKMLGYGSRGEMIGRPLTEIDAKLDMEDIKGIASNIQYGIPRNLQTLHKHADGTLIPVEMSIALAEDDPSGLIFGLVRDLRPQIKYEEDLKESNERLLEAQKIAKVGSWSIDFISQECFWSDQIFRMVEAVPSSFIVTEEVFYSFVHPEDLKRVRTHFIRCLHQKENYSIKYRIITKFGKVKYVQEVANFLTNTDGQVISVKGISQDITEVELSQLELRLSQQNIKKFFENVHVGIVKKAINGDFIEVNPEFQRFTGYTFDELQSMTDWDLTPEKYAQEEEYQLKSLLELGQYGPYKKEYKTKSGNLIPVLLNGVRTMDAEGNEFIWSVVQDISEEERIKYELKGDVEKFKVLLTSGQLIAFDVDLVTGLTKTIRRKGEIDDNSFPIDEVNTLEDILFLIREEHRLTCVRKIEQVVGGNMDHFSIDFQIKSKGELVWYEGILSVLDKNADGVVTKVFLTLRNIEHEKNQEILRLKIQENERLRISRDIHDSIGQMLVATRLTLQMHLRKHNELTDVDELLDEMIKESRMIINNFGISLQEVTLKDSFLNLIEKMGKVYTGQIDMRWRGNETIDDLKIATYVFRIFQEALSNAIKYSESNNILIKVENDGLIHMVIVDDGEGFNPENVEVGFGLNSMMERAKEIQYRLHVQSTIGNGTVVTLEPDL